MLFYGLTDVGKRRTANQDDFTVRKCSDDVIYAVVCDGMGGANGGNIASSLATGAFRERLDAAEGENPAFFGMSEDEILALLTEATKDANMAVYDKSGEDPSLTGMGTTLVGCVVSGENLYAVNVGDSRLYVVDREGGIRQVSHDHSYVQYLVDMGKMTPEEAKTSKNKNLITRAVGTERKVEIDTFAETVAAGDVAVLCSDGLSNLVEPGEIAEIARRSAEAGDMQAAAEELIRLANDRGGLDNITAVLLAL